MKALQQQKIHKAKDSDLASESIMLQVLITCSLLLHVTSCTRCKAIQLGLATVRIIVAA